MPRSSLPRASLGAVVSLLLCGSLAWGQQVEPVELRYKAAAGCPSEAEFTRQILARTSQARFTASAAGIRTFSVTLTRRARSFTGKLGLGEPGKKPAVREIRGDSCEEVASALALLVALAVDPEAITAPSLPASAAPSASAPPPPSAVPATSAIAALSALPVASAAPPASAVPAGPAPAASASVISPAPAAPDHPWSVAVGATAAVRRAPGLLPGGILSVAFEPAPTAASPWVWAGRVGIGVNGLGSASGDSGNSGVFRWRVASLEACPLAWGKSVVLRPCATLELGQIEGQGREGAVFQPLTNARFWAAAGAEGRLQWSLLERISLEASLGLVVPLSSYSFVFERPLVPVYKVPAVGGLVGLGVGYHFL